MTPQLSLYRGFDPRSPTLRGPEAVAGECLGDEFPHGRTMIWLDPGAAAFTGDVAIIEGRYGAELMRWGKVLAQTRDGRIWGLCNIGAMPLDALPAMGFSDLTLQVVVARLVFPRRIDTDPMPPPPPDWWLALMRRLEAPALREWSRYGFPPRKRLEIRKAA